MGSLLFGIISGALAAFQTFTGSLRQSSAQRAQARVMEANARIERNNAALEAQAANAQIREKEAEKSRLRRDFRSLQAHNRISLGAGNVDMASGSALDVELGNINNFAADMGENAYAVALQKWEARERERMARERADIQEANASWLARSSGNPATSLLTAGISGFGGFAQGYALSGGSLGKLFGGK